MARIDWIEERLQNWARWRLARGGSGVMGYAAVNLVDSDAGRSGYITAAVPISDAEAAATDEAVQRLSPRGLVLTVFEVYCGRDGLEDKARRLSCSVATVHRRVEQAHEQLREHFLAREDKARNERARVESVQFEARVGSFPRYR